MGSSHELPERGVWRSDKLVNRYEKAALMNKTWMAHPAALRTYAELCASRLTDAALHLTPEPRPKVLK